MTSRKPNPPSTKSLGLLLCLFVPQISTFGHQLPKFQVDAKQVDGKTAVREEKMRLALLVFEKVMNDESFQKKLRDLKFYSDRPDDPNRHLTDEQVVKKIYAAKEHHTSEEDNKADIWGLSKKRSRWVKLFTGCSVLGFGDEENKEVYTYTCFLDAKDTELTEIVGHIAHEWTHKLGFVHQFDDHPRRNETVSYAFGILVSKHAEKYTKTSANSNNHLANNSLHHLT